MTRRSLVLGLSAAAAQAAGAPLRVLLVTGGHDHPPSFYSIFETSEFRVTVDPHPRAFAYDMRRRFDVIVLYDMIKSGLDERKRENLKAFAESGKGIVVVHHAFKIYDETYGKLWFSKDIQVLLRTSHPTSDGPVVWVGPWKKSRVITVQPGHGSEAHHNENYRRLLRNAIAWAGGQK